MIEKRTVFVLGAGASSPYGFPTGRELTKTLLDELAPDKNMGRVLLDNGIGIGEVENFKRQLRLSGRYSVDAFLEHRQEFMWIGKLAIAHALISKEVPERIWNTDPDFDWYRNVFNKMNCKVDRFTENKVSFITFNYDRSLEHYLFSAAKSLYKFSDTECSDAMRSFPIIHLHGRLCALPWQSSEFTREYANIADIGKINAAAKEIKIIHEDIEAARDEDFKTAKRLLHEAQRILFLGFGYDHQNCIRLGVIREESLPCMALGSWFGLTQREKHTITSRLPVQFALPDNGNRQGCEEFLREHAVLN
jgi:hypothetical protein